MTEDSESSSSGSNETTVTAIVNTMERTSVAGIVNRGILLMLVNRLKSNGLLDGPEFAEEIRSLRFSEDETGKKLSALEKMVYDQFESFAKVIEQKPTDG